MNNRNVRWLHGQLPVLVDHGLLTAQNAEDIRRFYGGQEAPRQRRAVLLVCGVLGATLVGLGLILLLAHNWYHLTRPIRTILAFAPLVGAQSLTAWVGLRRAESVVWREGAAIFHQLMIAASLALVHQTYHIPMEAEGFTLIWMLLSLPLVFLLQATIPAVAYLAGIASWSAAGISDNPGKLLAAWLLAMLIVPLYLSVRRKQKQGARLNLLYGTILLWLIPGTFLTIEAVKTAGEPALPVFTGLFALMYLGGKYLAERDGGGLSTIPASLGAAGIMIAFFPCTFAEAWHQPVKAGGYLVLMHGFNAAAVVYYLLAAVVPLLALGLTVHYARLGRTGPVFLGLAPVLALAGPLVAGFSPGLTVILFNGYFLALAIGLALAGLRQDRYGLANLGFLLLAGLVLARFFDSTLGFTARALAFILVGLGFLAANVLLLRRRKGGRDEK